MNSTERSTLKLVAQVNTFGYLLLIAGYAVYLKGDNSGWGQLFLLVMSYFALPNIIGGLFTFKALRNESEGFCRNVAIVMVSPLLIPCVALPYFYEFGGLVLLIGAIFLGYLILKKAHKPLVRLLYLHIFGIILMAFISCLVFGDHL